MLSLSVHKNVDYSAPVVFIPLGAKTTASTQPKQITPLKTITQNKKIVPTPKKSTIIAPATPSPSTKATKDTSVIDVKKTEPTKPKIEPIKEVVKIEPSIAQALDIQQKITPPSFAPLSPRLQSARKASEGTAVIPENAHISHNYREVEALRKQAQLQKELVQKWKPPIGVSPDCTCDVSFFVTTKGGIENIKMVKTSGVMMFDISARQALFSTKMPQWAHGQTLTISFKQ